MEEGRCDEDVKQRIGLACAAFGGLGKMWREKSISVRTKVKLYYALVVPVWLYGSECWCLRKEDERRLLAAEMSWLRRIIGRSRREKVTNEKTREELWACETVVEKIKKRRLLWFRHVICMQGGRLPIAELCMEMRREREAEGGKGRSGWTMSEKNLKQKNTDLTRIGKATRNKRGMKGRRRQKATFLARRISSQMSELLLPMFFVTITLFKSLAFSHTCTNTRCLTY